MGWIIAIILLVIISLCADSGLGPTIVAIGVVALGLLLISWITGAGFFVFLAKACAVIIVVIIIAVIVMAIFSK